MTDMEIDSPGINLFYFYIFFKRGYNGKVQIMNIAFMLE